MKAETILRCATIALVLWVLLSWMGCAPKYHYGCDGNRNMIGYYPKK